MTTTPPDSPAETDEFLRKQAEFESAYRTTGDPQVLWHALLHAWSSRRLPTGRVVLDVGSALIGQRTGKSARRYRERLQHVRRYIVVRDLRSNGHTKPSALDQAVKILEKQRAAAERETIEKSYDSVKKDLERRGRESEFFYLVELVPEAPVLAPRADSTLFTADSTIPTADTAGGTAAPTSTPWFMRIAKR
jgi:hypothetical protein